MEGWHEKVLLRAIPLRYIVQPYFVQITSSKFSNWFITVSKVISWGKLRKQRVALPNIWMFKRVQEFDFELPKSCVKIIQKSNYRFKILVESSFHLL